MTSEWHSVAISDDGNTIAIAGRANSRLYVSRDRSLTWVQTPAPIGDYTALAMSADGHQFVVAAGTPGSAAGQLYTSLGNRTSIGAAGSIGGGINDFVELEYLGNARFKVRSFDGGPFTIR